MPTKTILEAMGETYIYQCCICRRGGLSRDEVSEIKKKSGAISYVCDECSPKIKDFQEKK